jgi:hypothetical protein
VCDHPLNYNSVVIISTPSSLMPQPSRHPRPSHSAILPPSSLVPPNLAKFWPARVRSSHRRRRPRAPWEQASHHRPRLLRALVHLSPPLSTLTSPRPHCHRPRPLPSQLCVTPPGHAILWSDTPSSSPGCFLWILLPKVRVVGSMFGYVLP